MSSSRIEGVPAYDDLDRSGEAQRAAQRMEARAKESASAAMFDALVKPLLKPDVARVLELGCGTAALSRRIAQKLPQATIRAVDKSQGMIDAATQLARAEGHANIEFETVDISAGLPKAAPTDLVISSVVVAYLDDDQTTALIAAAKDTLAPGGVLAFLEQDLQTDALYFPDNDLLKRVFAKDRRQLKKTQTLGLRPALREAGFADICRSSFVWTDEGYGPYLQDLLAHLAADAEKQGRITAAERARWQETLSRVAAKGDFYYGLVYHLLTARKPNPR